MTLQRDDSIALASALIMDFGLSPPGQQGSCSEREHPPYRLASVRDLQANDDLTDEEMEDGELRPKEFEANGGEDLFVCNRRSLDLNKG